MVKFIRSAFIISLLIFIPLTWLTPGYSSAQKQTSKTVKDLYPGLASGVLKSATPANLPKGTLLTAGDLTINESEITKVISQSEPAVRKQLTRNAFFLLENMATQKLLLEEAKKAGFVKGGENKAISDFISGRIKVSAVTDEEVKNFHNQNKMIANAPLEQLRETIKDYLTQQRRQEAVQQFILTLGQRTPIQINEDWVKKQSTLALDNPVDRARTVGQTDYGGIRGHRMCRLRYDDPHIGRSKKEIPGKIECPFCPCGSGEDIGGPFRDPGYPGPGLL